MLTVMRSHHPLKPILSQATKHKVQLMVINIPRFAGIWIVDGIGSVWESQIICFVGNVNVCVTKFIRSHPLGTLNTFTKLHGSPY